MTLKQHFSTIFKLKKYQIEIRYKIFILINNHPSSVTKSEQRFIKEVIQPLFWRYLKQRGLKDVWEKSNLWSHENYKFRLLDEAVPTQYFNQTVSWGGCQDQFGIDWQQHHDQWSKMLENAMLTEYHKILEDKTKKKKTKKHEIS